MNSGHTVATEDQNRFKEKHGKLKDVNWRRQRAGIHCQVYCSFPKRVQKADNNVELPRSPDGYGEGTL